MTTSRAAALILALLPTVSGACAKTEQTPFVYSLDGKPKTEAPAAQPTGAATQPAGLPPSGNPAAFTNPKFYLPTESELTTTASGLKYMVIREGSGTPPTATDRFTAHYCGWYTNGEVFDSSYSRNEPLNYPVFKMIPGWQEALVMMKPGSEYILVVSPELGYGVGGGNGIPPNSTLVFRMELLSTGG